jgi:hypothetical protein
MCIWFRGTKFRTGYRGTYSVFEGIVVMELLTREAEPVEVPNVVQGVQGTWYACTGYLVTFCRSSTSRGTPWYRLAILALAIFLIATGKLSRIRLYNVHGLINSEIPSFPLN